MKDVFGILVYQALCFTLESRNGAIRPPFFKVSVFVKQPSYKNKTIFVTFAGLLLSGGHEAGVCVCVCVCLCWGEGWLREERTAIN